MGPDPLSNRGTIIVRRAFARSGGVPVRMVFYGLDELEYRAMECSEIEFEVMLASGVFDKLANPEDKDGPDHA